MQLVVPPSLTMQLVVPPSLPHYATSSTYLLHTLVKALPLLPLCGWLAPSGGLSTGL